MSSARSATVPASRPTWAWRRRVAARMAAGLLAVTVAAVAIGLFWPAPVPALRCEPKDPQPCQEASGRVLWVVRSDARDPRRPLHLVLLSKDSVVLPGITFVKIPPQLRPARTPGAGRWVSVVGDIHEGSRGLPDIGVSRVRFSP